MWGCRTHWFALPREIRTVIWANYRPGQEVRKDPSSQYLEAAKIANDWARRYEKERASRCSICAEKLSRESPPCYIENGVKHHTCDWCHCALMTITLHQKLGKARKGHPAKILKNHIEQYGKAPL